MIHPWPLALILAGTPRDGAVADSFGPLVRLGAVAATDPAIRQRVLAHELTHVAQWWRLSLGLLGALVLVLVVLDVSLAQALPCLLPALLLIACGHNLLAGTVPAYLRMIEVEAYRAQWQASGASDQALLVQYARALAAQVGIKESEALEALTR